MGEVVGEAQRSDLGEPVLVSLAGSDKELLANFMENVARETADHFKQSKLRQMEKGLSW